MLPRLRRLGIATVGDLIRHFPARYEDFSNVIEIGAIETAGAVVSVQGEVVKIETVRAWKKNMTITSAMVSDASGGIRVVWFNQPYLENTFPIGTLVSLSGKVGLDKRGLYLSNPGYEKISNDELRHTGRLVPIYAETEGVTSKYLRFLIKPLLEDIQANDSLPSSIRECHGFPELSKALTTIHYPTNLDEAEKAKERFAFEDL